MNSHTRDVLELPHVLGLVEQYVVSPIGRGQLRRLRPSHAARVVSLRLHRTKEALLLLSAGDEPNLEELKDPTPVLRRASADATLSGPELVIAANLLAESRRLRDFFAAREEVCPVLSAMFSPREVGPSTEGVRQVSESERLESSIWHAVEITGEVRDDASPKLAGIRRRIAHLEQQARAQAASMATLPSLREVLQEPEVHFKGGRPVLPVKVMFRERVKGVVRDVSASGATLFIEPLDVAKMSAKLEKLRKAETKEELQIRKALSLRLGGLADFMSRMRAAIARIELAFAAARFGLSRGGCCAELCNDGAISLKRLRHPLLEAECIPMSLDLNESRRTVLVTGPNTGGKTVALKNIGLAVLMTACGLPVLADEGTQIPVFRDVLVDIGDEQSIEQSLSTFSGHMANTVAVMQRFAELDRGYCLVLLDEMGAGTDPEEGQALGCAILEWLHDAGLGKARILATSHFAGLKEVAATTDGMANARMQFDPETLRPTFELKMGASGASQAFPVAARLGLEPGVLARASAFLGPDRVQLRELLALVERERAVVRNKEEELRSGEISLEQRREEFEIQAREKLTQANRQREEFRKEALDLLSESRRKLKKARKGEDMRATQRRHVELDHSLSSLAKAPGADEEPLQPVAEVEAGQHVVVKDIGEGVLVELNEEEGTGVVAIRGFQVEVSLTRIKLGSGKKPIQGHVDLLASTDDAFGLELKLLGMRAEEARDEVEKYLDRAGLAGLSQIRIVHGMGKGVLREVVRTMLTGHPLVKRFRNAKAEEGGSGATVVYLE